MIQEPCWAGWSQVGLNDVAAMAVQHGSDTARFRVRCTYQELPEPILGPPSAARMPGRTLQGVIATSLPAQSSTWHAVVGFAHGFAGFTNGSEVSQSHETSTAAAAATDVLPPTAILLPEKTTTGHWKSHRPI